MSEVLVWPVVRREEIVRAFSPGTAPAKESPFRALRAKRWATAGVSVPRRRAGRLAGQLVVYSSLNVDAARLVRHGDTDAGRRAAEAAETVEAGALFLRVCDLLQRLTAEQQQAAVDGQLPAGGTTVDLEAALWSLAEEIAAHRAAADLPHPDDRFAGHVSERRADSVVISAQDGTRTAAPLWMVRAAHRDQVGDRVVLVSVRLDDHQALMQAVPGIDIPAQRSAEPDQGAAFSPFGRTERRTLEVTPSDLDALRGVPEPLRVLVPVTIDR
jgi:hypothetical protein